jgi:hypothetical protein
MAGSVGVAFGELASELAYCSEIEIGANLATYKNRQPTDQAIPLRRYTSLNALEHTLRDTQLRLTRVDSVSGSFRGIDPFRITDGEYLRMGCQTQDVVGRMPCSMCGQKRCTARVVPLVPGHGHRSH